MPFKSKAQRRALYAKDPAVAAEFEAATPKGKELPEKVKSEKPPPKKSAKKAKKAAKKTPKKKKKGGY